MYHYRKNFIRYKKLNKKKVNDCSFCEDDFDDRIVEETEHFCVIRNRVAYDLWETRAVTDHLLIVPKVHVVGFSDMAPEVQLEMMQIIGPYEVKGYHVYARGQGAVTRSQHHQHTHLIKTRENPARLQISVAKPHVVIKL